MGQHPLNFSSIDFARTPFLVIWEVTQACPLACRHCRASAELRRDPLELSTSEGKALIDAVADLGTPVMVLSGGDPLQRDDLPELVAHGRQRGLRMATIPAASEHLTRARLAELAEAGLSQIAFSLDGSTAELHDGFRGVPGTFARTLEAARWARELGLPLQINSTFTRHNLDDVAGLAQLVEELGVVFWEVFSLVPVGRGTDLHPLDAVDHELLFRRLYEMSQRVSFVIKVTEAPHYRRYVLQQRRKEGTEMAGDGPKRHLPTMAASGSAIPAQLSRELSTRASFGARAKGINSGKGFAFVSHQGHVFPSGFFPVPVGDVRTTPLAELYRETALMQTLRDPSSLAGRCGRCEYADVCGGSRARALAITGDALAEDPACAYQPAATSQPATS